MPYVTPAVKSPISPGVRKNGFVDYEKEFANRQKTNVIEITR